MYAAIVWLSTSVPPLIVVCTLVIVESALVSTSEIDFWAPEIAVFTEDSIPLLAFFTSSKAAIAAARAASIGPEISGTVVGVLTRSPAFSPELNSAFTLMRAELFDLIKPASYSNCRIFFEKNLY